MKNYRRNLTILAVLTALLIILGYFNLPMPAGLSITFNMIPVAVAAIALGPTGGAVIGGAFGMISFLQCFGICGSSGMGAILVNIDPFLTFIQRFIPRLLDGWLLGWLYRLLKDRTPVYVGCAVTGFFAAFFNTLFFMTSLVWLFGGTEYMQSSMAGRGVLAYIAAAVGINGVVEMLVSTLLTGAVGTALVRARFATGQWRKE
ncbi:MAG: ECF transporter S component [Clostridia bacterium]|nr:ECF transporter S component [Clostridia bacterium]